MMAYLSPWLRRLFSPAHPAAPVAVADEEAPDHTADGFHAASIEPMDHITRDLDAAFSEHRRVFRQEADQREQRLKKLAAAIDDCLGRNTLGREPARKGHACRNG